MKQLAYLWKVNDNYYYSQLDVPFTSGHYTHGEEAFYKLTESKVYYDSGIQSFLSFHF